MNSGTKYRKLNYILGNLSELLIALLLNLNSFTLIKRRYKNQNYEIDLIMQNKKEEIIRFIEVKFRLNKHSINYIDFEKCKKIYSSAEYFLQQNLEFLKFSKKFKLYLITCNSIKIINIY